MSKKKLIVYFVPQKKVVNGGVLSIFSQAKEARRFFKLHRSEVIISTYPGYDTYRHNDLFPNDERVYSFDEVVNRWKAPDKLLLHIPECAVVITYKVLHEKYLAYLNQVKDLSINVMTQNIKLLPRPGEFADLFNITLKLTQTAAHSRYATQTLSDRYQTPVHHLSVFNDQDQYNQVPYDKKKNLILYSPDAHPAKEAILRSLSSLEEFRTQEIKNLTYVQYKDLVSQSKFCLSFGEGFDGYFIESYFSGGIGISIYNDEFFPDKSFQELPSVFESYASMAESLASTIQKLNDERLFNDCVKLGQKKINKLYRFEDYLKKMEAYYKGRYDYRPNPKHSTELVTDILSSQGEKAQDRDFYEKRLLKELGALKSELFDAKRANQHLGLSLEAMQNSHSWKLTKPLREAVAGVNKLIRH